MLCSHTLSCFVSTPVLDKLPNFQLRNQSKDEDEENAGNLYTNPPSVRIRVGVERKGIFVQRCEDTSAVYTKSASSVYGPKHGYGQTN